MSVYKEIKTEYKTAQSLVKALTDVFGVRPYNSTDFRLNTLELRSEYHSENVKQAAIMIDRATMKAKVGSKGVYAYGGLGFAWNGHGYDMIADNLNEGELKPLFDEIKQRYTYHEIKRQALVKGYSVQEQKAADGTIRLQLRSLR